MKIWRAALGLGMALPLVMVSTAMAGEGTPDPRLSQAQASVEKTRELLRTGRLADAVTAAMRLDGMVRRAASPVPAPSAAMRSTLGQLPAELEKPVVTVLAAIGQAEAVTAPALDGVADPTAHARAMIRYLARPTSAPPRVGVVDRAALGTGALLVAEALDEAIPELEAYAATLPVSTATAAGCDVVDAAPVLCIGGAGANTYRKDAALVIDLGGNDVHLHSAGGADPRSKAGLPVAVTVDVGGDDRYQANLPLASGARVAQGAGFTGGVGLLVDQAGNDRYSASAGAGSIGAGAQGLGVLAAGVLADRGGHDRYALVSRSAVEREQLALGGGVAGEGLGLQLDEGVGNDDYLTEARALLRVDGAGKLHPGFPSALSYGIAAAAPAIFSDGGGRDSMAVVAAVANVGPRERRPLVESLAIAEGFGLAALQGQAMSLSESGRTTRRVVATACVPRLAGTSVLGFGSSLLGGTAVSSDAGGDDRYVAEAIARATADAVTGVPASASTDGAQTLAMGTGFALPTGVGLLEDRKGNDVYRLAATSRAEVTTDRAVTATASSGFVSVDGQGAGLLGAAGFLVDRNGADRYTASGDSRAVARAPGGRNKATTGLVRSNVQAAGFVAGRGELRDHDGADEYIAKAASSATAPGGRTFRNPVESSAQASVVGTATALLVDDGEQGDLFLLTPRDPACLGTRGVGTWRDCGEGLGVGINRR